MTAFKLNIFSGLRPRMPESLLPNEAATIARNCDFAYGELRATKDGFKLNVAPLANLPQSIYTDDGLSFYTWASDVDAVRSPLINDTYNRLYFNEGGTIKVTNRLGTQITGGPPGSSYTVGVPRPTVAPKLTVSFQDVTDSTKYALTFKYHYEYSGVKYQEHTVTPVSLGGTTWQVTPGQTMTRQVTFANSGDFPKTGETGVVYKATDTGKLYTWGGSSYTVTTTDATPAQAFGVLRITCVDKTDNSQLFDIYSDNSSISSTGGIWSLSLSGTTATLTASIKEKEKEARAYVYTFVNTYDEEGPPSAPTVVTTATGVKMTVTVVKDTQTGYAPIKEIRVYRTPSGSSIAEYFYVGTLTVLTGVGAFTFNDDVKGEQLNEVLSSTGYYPPPSSLGTLLSLPNGILCATKGTEVWFSEAYKPWAWNPANAKPLNGAIVNGIAHGSGAVITTTKNPYIISGVSPDSMTATRLNVDQAGVSKWSIAVVDGTVMYASHDGLVVITGGSASLAQGQKFFTREVWREKYGAGLNGMRFSVWDGRLVVFHQNNVFSAFMIRVDEADGTLTDLPNLSATCAFVSQSTDQFYYANANNLYQFNGGADLSATWQSREMVLVKPVSYAMMQTVCTGTWAITVTAALDKPPDISKRGTFTRGIWTVTISGTDVTATANLTAGDNTIRMVDGFESARWKIKLVGSGRFRELRVAKSGRELAQL